jgi:hypothetical protein
MPTVHFNKAAFNILLNRSGSAQHCWTSSFDNAAYADTLSGGQAGSNTLTIYKGTAESFPTWTDRTTRAADVLLTFSLPSTTNSFLDLPNDSATARRMILGRHLTNQTAAASGIATWFVCGRSGNDFSNRSAVIGSVGVSGSGADLEIPTTSIVSGQNYRCNGFYLNLQLSFSF